MKQEIEDISLVRKYLHPEIHLIFPAIIRNYTEIQ